MDTSTIETLKKIFELQGYTWNNDLNIVGYRTKNIQVNKFDDYLFVCYKDVHEKWVIKKYLITTDPGISYMKKLLNKAGTGALVHGQYENIYAIDLHQGTYEALCQRLGNVKVYRDKNLDSKYDYNDASIQSGMYGVNIHCAGEDSINVDNWSAACQVFKRKKDFLEFMKIINSFKKQFNNKFTYTLLDINKQNITPLV